MVQSEQGLALTNQSPFVLGEARIDPPLLRIDRNGSSRRVEAKVMRVLLALARNPGRVVSRRDLEREVWPGRIVTDDALTNAVVKLRKALEDNPRHPQIVETIAKSGYRLKLQPETLAAEPEAAAGAHVARPWRWGLVALLAVIAAAGLTGWLSLRHGLQPGGQSPAPDQSASVAVIPFEVLGGDISQAYFSEGITLDLITELSQLPGLLVIAPSTTFGYRGTRAGDREIGTELGVAYLVRGAVQRSGDQLRINARLVAAADGQTLWAERFTGAAQVVFQIQDQVTQGVAAALRVRLVRSAKPINRSGATGSIAAYDEFLRGQEHYGRRTREDNQAARDHFERAVALDPAFARAHAGLALAWSRLAIDGWTEDPGGALSKSARHAEDAAVIDPSVPQIHFVRAQVELFRGHHDAAAAAASTALELDPNYADAYALLAWVLHYSGRPDQAWPALGEARRRNPVASASYRQIAGEIYFATGRYRQAEGEFRAALQRNPAHTRARLWLALTLVKLQREDEAIWEAQELTAANPDFALHRLLLAFPLKDPQQSTALTEALARLGLPE
jgi:TolB-like protein/DNA-binding winged helix-turn-helix (wHTH) protein/Tfp pilus assembly protein PilF